MFQAPESNGRQMSRTVLVYTGRIGDHNDRGMRGAAIVGAALGRRLGVEPTVLGSPEPAINGNWDVELDAAMPGLRTLQAAHADALASGGTPVFAWPRCAAAIATLPNVAAQYPDAVVVWFDAHADLNTPDNSTTGYLGGLALSASLGWWDSGLGAGLDPRNVVLGGTRDLDPSEQSAVDAGVIALAAGPDMLSELDRIILDRPVYFHLDCDVLDPGIMPTDYSVPGGLTLEDLHHVAARLALNTIVGVEIGEFEDHGNSGLARAQADSLIDALGPILK
jgi:arginase